MRKLLLNKGRHEILIDDEDYDAIMDAPQLSAHGKQYSWTVSGVGKRQKVRSGPITGPHLYLHLFLMQPEKGQVVIFKSDNRFDFRRENLILTDRSCVGQKRGMPSSKAGYRGVIKFQEGWQAKICKNSKDKILGYYMDKTHAARAYNIAAKEYFGDDAYQNDVPDDIVPVRYKLKVTFVLDTEEAA